MVPSYRCRVCVLIDQVLCLQSNGAIPRYLENRLCKGCLHGDRGNWIDRPIDTLFQRYLCKRTTPKIEMLRAPGLRYLKACIDVATIRPKVRSQTGYSVRDPSLLLSCTIGMRSMLHKLPALPSTSLHARPWNARAFDSLPPSFPESTSMFEAQCSTCRPRKWYYEVVTYGAIDCVNSCLTLIHGHPDLLGLSGVP